MSCTIYLDKIENKNTWHFGYPIRDYLTNAFGENAVLDSTAICFLNGLRLGLEDKQAKKILGEVIDYLEKGGQIKLRMEC